MQNPEDMKTNKNIHKPKHQNNLKHILETFKVLKIMKGNLNTFKHFKI